MRNPIFILPAFLLLSIHLFAQDFPEPMQPARAVNDFAGLLSSGEQARLEQKLRNFNDTTSSAIVVVTVNSTNGMEIAQYTTELAHRWGVGRADVDNGLVILVSKNDRTINISTGYGMEGAVPDALAKRIIEQDIKPRFREGNYYAGLNDATTTIMRLASGEYTAEDVGGERNAPSGSFIVPVLVLLFLIIFPILRMRAFKKHHLGNNKRSMSWLSMLLLMSSMNSHKGRSYNDFRGGGGIFGGGGGGGFGGFGGGGFGGGGASGSW